MIYQPLPGLKPFQGILPRWTNPAGIPRPVGAWVMNENGGNTLYDLINGQDGAGTNASIVWKPGGIYPTDGVSEQIKATRKSIFPSGNSNYSLVSSVRHDNVVGSYDTIFAYDNWDPQWIIQAGEMGIYDGDLKGSVALVSNSIDHTLAWVREGTGAGQTKEYVDGVLGGTTTHADALDVPAILNIGSSGHAAEHFNGIIYYIYFYNQALSLAQIAYLHQHPYYAWEYPELWGYSVTGVTNVTITPNVISLLSSVSAETVNFGATISPSAINLASVVQAETIIGDALVTPNVQTLIASIQAELVKYGVTMTPSTLDLASGIQAEVISAGVKITPGAIQLVSALQDEVVVTASSVTITPGAIILASTPEGIDILAYFPSGGLFRLKMGLGIN